LLTTTFIDREIRSLRQAGVAVRVVSIRRPGSALSSTQRSLMEQVTYVFPVRPLALLGHLLGFAFRRPVKMLVLFVRLMAGDHPTLRSRFKTLAHAVLGVHVAGLVRDWRPRHLHAHFVDRATTVAMVVSALTDVPFSATAHANDIYVSPVLLAEKVRLARPLVTCTSYNAVHLSRVTGRNGIRVIRHGLELDMYRPHRADRDVSRIVSVGQLKEKKGFTYLIAACRRLRDLGFDFRCDIVGEGPLREALTDEIARFGLEHVVSLRGSLDHAEVVELLDGAGAFALASVMAGDGDRDGIPNVILEAMAMELPVVSTHHSGIPEAVEDGVTGFLVPPGDSFALASALGRLLKDPELARSLGRAGREVVERRFDAGVNAAAFHAEVLT
ncbi:MAG: glycosyltransferase, partial [Acidimicrobiia bacterium]